MRLNVFFLVLIYFLLLLHVNFSNAQIIVINNINEKVSIKNRVTYIEDKTGLLSIKDVVASTNFKTVKSDIPNFGISSSSFWVKLQIKNNIQKSDFLLQVSQPGLDGIELYQFKNDSSFISEAGEYLPFNKRQFFDPNYIFTVNLPKGNITTIYIKVKARDNIQLPIFIGTKDKIIEADKVKDMFVGIYLGIMLVMLFYNAFLYFTVRDKGYLYYVIYIATVILTQASIQGYTFQYLWPNLPALAGYSSFIFPPLVGIAGLYFMRHFLATSTFLPRLNNFYHVFTLGYSIAFIIALIGFFQASFILIEIVASAVSIFMLIVAYKIYRKGYRPAKFFLIAWFIFLIGVSIYVMKDLGILPYNNFTYYMMPIGSAIEVVLLSLALADRINILKKEKEESQAATLLALEGNKKLITEQNIMLEHKVQERTVELKEANKQLSLTLTNLKETQMQLINADKMASLGQLTAGIAHEINNPINFVSANLKPLKMDISDVLKVVRKYEKLTLTSSQEDGLREIEVLKQEVDLNYLEKEIEMLLSGIEDGAKRTAEIVAGLRNFSRLDESEVKETNINEGVESTLALLKHTISKGTQIILELDEIPLIECLPGKLNQVFMNVLSNAIYALNQKKNENEKKLVIKSYVAGENICLSFEDTGIGMTPEVKAKIFDPFFTTKDVGEGTGLGMSIVFKIIESHHAKMEINSSYGIGTKVLIILNKKISKIIVN
jgi:signal transduction histidine kinase